MIKNLISFVNQYGAALAFETSLVLCQFGFEFRIDPLGSVPLYLRLTIGLLFSVDVWLMLFRKDILDEAEST